MVVIAQGTIFTSDSLVKESDAYYFITDKFSQYLGDIKEITENANNLIKKVSKYPLRHRDYAFMLFSLYKTIVFKLRDASIVYSNIEKSNCTVIVEVAKEELDTIQTPLSKLADLIRPVLEIHYDDFEADAFCIRTSDWMGYSEGEITSINGVYNKYFN